MSKYEYSTVEWLKRREGPDDETLSQLLNRKGQDGWIFADAILSPVMGHELVFMRPLSEATGDALQTLFEVRSMRKVSRKQDVVVGVEPEHKGSAWDAAAADRAARNAEEAIPFTTSYPSLSMKDELGRTPSVRACHAFITLDAMTVGAVLKLTEEQLRRVSNIGNKTVAEIKHLQELAMEKLT